MSTMKFTRNFFLVVCLGMFMSAATAGKPEPLLFTFQVGGEVMGAGSDVERVRGNTSPVWFDEEFWLGGVLLTDAAYRDRSAADCFPDFGDPAVGFNAQMQLTRNNSGAAQAILWFRGFSEDGKETEVKYELTLVDPVGWRDDSGGLVTEFPPIGTSIWMNATEWTMTTEGKGQLKKVSCTGSGDSVNVLLTLDQS